MGSKDAVFLQPVLKNQTVFCLACEENKKNHNTKIFAFLGTCGSFARKSKAETRNIYILKVFMIKMDGLKPNQFQRIHMNNVPICEGLS